MDIKNERREYLQSGEEGLRSSDLNDNPFSQFAHWLDEAKAGDIKDPTGMMLATVDAQGQPHQRTVLLKAFSEQGFSFFTNLGSRKASHIQQNQAVSLIFPWLSMERQVIISGKAVALSAKDNAEYFSTRPRDSQLAAWVSRQSQPTPNKQALFDAFAATTAQFADKDVALPTFWGGFRVEPSRIEFWSGSAKRLHDRFEYNKQGDSWSRQRLQP